MNESKLITLLPLKETVTKTCPKCKEQFKTIKEDLCIYCEPCQESITVNLDALAENWLTLGLMDEKNR